MTIHTINNVKQHHIVPDSFEAMILKLFMVLPKIDPVFENWLFYSTGYIRFIPSLLLLLLLLLLPCYLSNYSRI